MVTAETNEFNDAMPPGYEAERPGWGWTLALGILSVIGGIAGFLNPFIASLTVEGLVAAFAIVAGVTQIGAAFRDERDRWARVTTGVLGVVLILFGASLFLSPLSGLLSLTILALSLFVAMGLMRMWMAWRNRDQSGWWAVALAGLITVVLAVFLFFSLPLTALTLLGFLLAIDLTVSGFALIFMALRRRRA